MTRTPNALPDGWAVVPLQEIAEVAFSGVDKKTVEGEVPVALCNYTDVFYNRRIHGRLDFMSATATPAEVERWSLRKGDVLFTKDSETPDEIGVPAYVEEDLPGVLCGYHLGRARPLPGRVDGAFLAASFQTSGARRRFARIANGVTRFGLTLGATRRLSVPLPPLPEQQTVSCVLNSLDRTLVETADLADSAQNIRHALRYSLLTVRRSPLHGKSRFAVSIPKTWRIAPLRSVATLGAGDPAPQDPRAFENGDHLFVRTADVGRLPPSGTLVSTRDRLTDATVQTRRMRRWPAGTILIPKSGASTALNNRARLATPAYVSSHLATVCARPGTLDSYLYHLLCEFDSRPLMRNAGYPSLGLNDLGSALVPIPSKPEQRAIAGVLDSVCDFIAATEAVARTTKIAYVSVLEDVVSRFLDSRRSL